MHTVPVATLCVLVVGLATVFSQSAAKAQTLETSVVAEIPFAFQVGGYHLAPGAYNVRMVGDFLWIKGEADSVVMVVARDSARSRLSDSALVFHRYGSQYFLREIRSAEDGSILWTGETKAERRAKYEEDAFHPNSTAREDSKVEVALLVSSESSGVHGKRGFSGEGIPAHFLRGWTWNGFDDMGAVLIPLSVGCI
jgi:hypothetical protein